MAAGPAQAGSKSFRESTPPFTRLLAQGAGNANIFLGKSLTSLILLWIRIALRIDWGRAACYRISVMDD
jgi:hypothetical protein